MSHYDDSALRRSIDEPAPSDPGLAVHLAACPPCRARRDDLAENAALAGRLFAEGPPAVDVDAGYERATRAAAMRRVYPSWMTGAIGLAVAACAVLALALTPLGGYAGQLLTIFEPKTFVPLTISARDSEQLRLMPTLERFGTFAASNPKQRKIASLAVAEPMLGFAPREFAYSFAGTSVAPRVYLKPQSSLSFTFSAAKARTYEAKFDRTLPAMPEGLDGTTFRATYGPMLMRVYARGEKAANAVKNGEFGDGVAFFESKAPRMTSTGAALDVAATYLLSMPNVPAGVAQQLRDIPDPEHTLPIPFKADKENATPVAVDGVQGLTIGDETGLGSLVLWQKNGIVYAIFGSIKESEALALAGSLK